MSKAKISLAGVSKSYISENEVTQALHKINLDFYFGEFVAITGESGGGKSTVSLHFSMTMQTGKNTEEEKSAIFFRITVL